MPLLALTSGPVACKTGLPRVGSESARVSAMTHETNLVGFKPSFTGERELVSSEGNGRARMAVAHNAIPQCHSRAWPLRQSGEGETTRWVVNWSIGDAGLPRLRMRSSGALGNLEMLT